MAITKAQAEQEFKKYFTNRPFTDQDLVNAQKFGLNIFRKSAERITGKTLGGTLPPEPQERTLGPTAPPVFSGRQIPEAQGSLANFRFALQQAANLARAQTRPTIEAELGQFAAAGVPLTTPTAISTALEQGTLGRREVEKPIFERAFDIIQEQEKNKERMFSVFGEIIQKNPTLLSNLQPDDIAQLQKGVFSTNLIQQVGKIAQQGEKQFVSGTENQVAGVFDKTTGKFTPLGGLGGGGVGVAPGIPTGVLPPSLQVVTPKTFEDFVRGQGLDASRLTPDRARELRQEFSLQPAQLAPTAAPRPQMDISQFDPVLQPLIRAQKNLDEIYKVLGDKEQRRLSRQLDQALQAGLIKPGEDELTRVQKITAFNNIVAKYQASPLVAAADRTGILSNTIKGIRQKPTDGATQLALIYGYIQALDNYQSAVREGEIALSQQIQSKIGKMQNYFEQINNGQILSKKAALDMANGAEVLVSSVNAGAQFKKKQFRSQAKVAGLGNQFEQYLVGFETEQPETQPGRLPLEDAWQEYLKITRK